MFLSLPATVFSIYAYLCFLCHYVTFPTKAPEHVHRCEACRLYREGTISQNPGRLGSWLPTLSGDHLSGLLPGVEPGSPLLIACLLEAKEGLRFCCFQLSDFEQMA